jgi:hypothetical protein
MKIELSNNQINIKGRRSIKGMNLEEYVLGLALYANLILVSNEYSGKVNQFYSITLKGTNERLYEMLIMMQNEHTDAHYTIH